MRRICALLLGSPVVMGGVILPALPAQAASPATRYVATTGTDTGSCTKAAPCRTINYAIAQSANGDTVSIAAGTYRQAVLMTQTMVNLVGAGADQTILSGLGAPEPAGSEILIAGGNPGSVTISGLTVNNARTSATSPNPAGPGYAADIADIGGPIPLTVDNVVLGGVVNPGSTIGIGVEDFASATSLIEHTTAHNMTVGLDSGNGGKMTATADTLQDLRSSTPSGGTSGTQAPVGIVASYGSDVPATLIATGNTFTGYGGVGVAVYPGSSGCGGPVSCPTTRATIAGNTFTLGAATAKAEGLPAAAIGLVVESSSAHLVAHVHNNTGTVTAPTRAIFTLAVGGLLELTEHANTIKVR